jgi:xanthine dehydrogenase accessory factor
MERRVITAALDVIAKGIPQKLDISLSDPEKGDLGVCGGQMEVFVEPVQPKPTIVVIGAGHVGQAVVHLAHWLGFHVIVSDDRPEFATPDVAPNADKYLLGTVAELANTIKINPHTYLVLTTRNNRLDVDGLPALLESQAAYIGVIGSKRRWQITRKNLKELGVSKKKLDAVVSPMGMEINAETPEEIAVSILSEIIMLRRGGDGKRMKS